MPNSVFCKTGTNLRTHMNNALQLVDLALSIGQRNLVRLTCDIPAGQVLTIMGPSGSGKSALLAAITGTLDPAFTLTGQVRLNDQDITRRPTRLRQIGILFQDDLLFPHMSVAANLAFGLTQSVKGRAARQQRVEDALTAVDLTGFGPRDPATLSGGERARVALMRCLLSEPRALLLDEPFSRLDAHLRHEVRQLVFAQSRALPVILVTHDPADAVAAQGPVLSPLGQSVTLPHP